MTTSPIKNRFRFAIRLRTMLLIVLVVALGLGYLDYAKRRAAVDNLLAQLKVRVFVSIVPTRPNQNPVFDPSGTYAAATKDVRRLGVESWAVTDLITALRTARLAQDETGLRGALAALQDLGPSNTAAREEVLRVVRGEGLTTITPNQFVLVRGLAIHVLGRIAKEDDRALDDLIASLDLPDPTVQRHLTTCAANEIGAFGPKARAAVPGLLRVLNPTSPTQRDEAISASISALGSIGSEARQALPVLTAFARDRNQAAFNRGTAIRSVSSILFFLQGNRNRWDKDYEPEYPRFLAELADDPDEWIQDLVCRLQNQIQNHDHMKRRRAESALMIAADRARGGHPRPAASNQP